MNTDMPRDDGPESGTMESTYTAAWRRSIEDPGAFWMDAADAVDWDVPPRSAFDPDEGWFPGGVLNTCHNCIDRHVLAFDAHPAPGAWI